MMRSEISLSSKSWMVSDRYDAGRPAAASRYSAERRLHKRKLRLLPQRLKLAQGTAELSAGRLSIQLALLLSMQDNNVYAARARLNRVEMRILQGLLRKASPLRVLKKRGNSSVL